ncbi:MAG: prepilin peptidase [Helicobacteraceae bacterium]|nr:prepilin peptidase [Helicobacteraceae bacterium]
MEFIFVFISFIFALCFGSFLNVIIVRMPQDKSIVLPSSACMSCENKLKFYHNIPLLSYLFLGGKCGFCGAKISILYPIVELISAIFGVFIYLKFGFSFEALFIGISVLLLLALSIIDLKFKAVPDSLNFWALIFALIGGILLHRDFIFIVGSSFAMAGFFTLLRFAFQSLAKKEVLGEGDIIVVATMGALLGYKLALIAIFISAVFSLIILLAFFKKDYAIPYIPFLFAGMLTCLFFDSFFLNFLNSYILGI